MIRVCCYKGCGVVYGEKEPLADKRATHGLCPKHLEISLREVKGKIEKMANSRNFRVLIVEDNAAFRKLFRGLLQERFPSITLYEAMDGQEALQRIEDLLPDLVFMDIRLPGGNGLDLTKRIKIRHPGIVVIIFTGFDLPEYRERSLQCADYFFSKGSSTAVNIFELVESILPTKYRSIPPESPASPAQRQ
ncbi:MAG: response regulator [Deltaproteobacteria bacterium]|nr:MAG: response regulator [Deltaproteobacteria bacterium]